MVEDAGAGAAVLRIKPHKLSARPQQRLFSGTQDSPDPCNKAPDHSGSFPIPREGPDFYASGLA
jgi:hypothetical protein